MTVIEALLLAKRDNLDPERVVVDILQLAKVEGIDENTVLLIAHYIKHQNVGVFDACHAAFCNEAEIISSDKIFDQIGFQRIQLEKR